jgi:aminoglycoside phosphotransferase (APT) family kinase protein
MTLTAGVAAIVDFELAALGNRWGDVCYFLMYCFFKSKHESARIFDFTFHVASGSRDN